MTSALEGSPKKADKWNKICSFCLSQGLRVKKYKKFVDVIYGSPLTHTQRERERESMGNVKEILGQISAFQFANVANIANILCEQNILPLFICGEAKQVYKRYDFLLFSSIQQVLGGQ